MATTPTGINAPARGITRILAGYVLESEGIDMSTVIDQTPDQMGAIADEQIYDHRYDLSLVAFSATSARIAPATTGDRITYDGQTYVVDRVAEAGTYNGKLKWTIAAHRFDNWPTQPG